MKILRISLSNIASLAGQHTVDFTCEPLKTAGLFAICGPTGAGKSALLDALCLALYERTPRLSQIGTISKISDGENLVTQKDPATLLRRGSSQGFAEVVFTGVDELIYTARWSVRRARGRSDGALQPTEMALFRDNVLPGQTGILEQGGKKGEVLAAIKAKAGLSFEQFTRAVLLAQNEFAGFLKAEDKERAEILQALTGTHRFEKISIAVFERHKAEKKAIEQIESKLAGVAPLSSELRETAETAVTQADQECAEAERLVTERRTHRDWHDRMDALSRVALEKAAEIEKARLLRDGSAPRKTELAYTEEVSRAAQPLRAAELGAIAEARGAQSRWEEAGKLDRSAQEALGEKQKDHALAVTELAAAKGKLDATQPELRQARDLDARLAPLAASLAERTEEAKALERVLADLAERTGKLTREKEAAEAEQQALAPIRQALAPYAAYAADGLAWIHRLDAATDASKRYTAAVAECKKRTVAIGKLEGTFTSAQLKERGLHESLRLANETLNQAQEAAAKYDAAGLSADRQATTTALAAVQVLREHLEKTAQLSMRAGNLRGLLADLAAKNKEESELLESLEKKARLEAELVAKASRTSCELAEAAVEEASLRLREKLEPGLECPVCGGLEHPFASHPPSAEAAVLRALREDRDKKESTLADIRSHEARLTSAVEIRTGQILANSKELDALQSAISVADLIQHPHPAAAEILAAPSESRTISLEKSIATHQEKLQSIGQLEAELRAAEGRLNEQRRLRDQITEQLAAGQPGLTQMAADLSGLRAAHAETETLRSQTEMDRTAAQKDLAPLFTISPTAASEWEKDAASFRESFSRNTAAYTETEKKAAQFSKLLGETNAALVPAREALASAGEMLEKGRAAEGLARNIFTDTESARKALCGGRAADLLEAELSEALRLAGARCEMLGAEANAAGKTAAATSTGVKHAADACERCTASCAEAEKAMSAWLAEFVARSGASMDRDRLDELLARTADWIRAEREALDALGKAVHTAEGAHATHLETLALHAAARPTLDEAPTVLASLAPLQEALDEAGKRRDAARLTLHADDQRRTDGADLTRELESRRTASIPWDQLNDLLGSSDGAKFRNIAQRRTLDVLLGYANGQLDQLAPRYRMERIPNSLNLLVVDRDMGDERRSIHSLSGGETFLVSLGLALGLASLTSHRLRIESLFIDEGFGSLDAETLNIALGALMHLEAQGRKVGVISHVAEMADAIPVQIRFIKGRAGSSRIEVPGRPRSEPLPSAVKSEGPADLSPEAIVLKLCEILRREADAGRDKVSVRALRKELGCTPEALNAARTLLGAEIQSDGSSLFLTPLV